MTLAASPDGRYWLSHNGWGRPVGNDFFEAIKEARKIYPAQTSIKFNL